MTTNNCSKTRDQFGHVNLPRHEKKMSPRRKDVTEKVDKVADEVREVTKARKMDRTDIIGEATKRMSAELRERDSKKDNLVIHGLNEPDPAVKGVDRKNADLESIRYLFEDMGVSLGSTEAIKFSFRPGPADGGRT